MKKFVKWFLIIVVGIPLFFAIVFAIFGIGKDNKESTTTSRSVKEEVVKLKSDTEIHLERLGKVQKMIDNYNVNDYTNSLEQLGAGQKLLDMTSEELKISEFSENDTVRTKFKEVKENLSKLNKDTYPILRKAFCELSQHTFWLEDIKESVSGVRNQELVFVGSVFTKNKRKQEFIEQIEPTIHQFRFKSVTLKWYDGDKDGSTWTFTNKNDDEL